MIIKKQWPKEKATYLKTFCCIFGVFFFLHLSRKLHLHSISYKHSPINPPSPPIWQVILFLSKHPFGLLHYYFYIDWRQIWYEIEIFITRKSFSQPTLSWQQETVLLKMPSVQLKSCFPCKKAGRWYHIS